LVFPKDECLIAFALWSDLANQKALRVTFNDGAPAERQWHRSQGLAFEHLREDACVRLRPEGVVFALRTAARNNPSCRCRDIPAHARCNDQNRAQSTRSSGLTSEVRRPIFREDPRGRLRAFGDARDGSETASHTAPQWARDRPLTVTDFASRYLIACEALLTTKERHAFTVFERAFEEFGLPAAIRTDKGVPFASAHALYGLSKLAVWWLRLGIRLERITPGHPQENGRHERMHLTLKNEATRPAAPNVLQQQVRFDAFMHRYNTERPHQALDMKTPAAIYTPSSRQYQGLDELDYPFHDWTAAITTCGRICYRTRKINVSQVFAGQKAGVTQVDDHIWLVTFMHYDLGNFDDETCRLEPIADPFGPKLLPMSPE
jgi:putative transposase